MIVPRPAPRRSRGSARLPAEHRDAELLVADVRRRARRRSGPRRSRARGRERPDLLELERHEQHAAPGVALLEQPLVHELDRADVEAARGLRGDRDAAAPRRARARSRPSAGCRPTASAASVCGRPPRTSYCSSSGRACCSIRLGESRPKRLSGGRRYSRSARFSASEKSSMSPRRWRSSAMWPTPAASAPCTPAPVTSRPADADLAAARVAQPGDRLDQLGLPVAVDAGDADDLAAAHRAARARAPPAARGRRSTSRSSTSSSGSPAARRLLLDAEQHVAADHQLGEARLRGALGRRPCRPSCRAAARSRGRRCPAPRAACAR